MEIRRVVKTDDFTAIAAIYTASWKAAFKDIIPQAYLDELSEARWASILPDSPWDTFVMTDSGKYIGTSSVCAARDEKLRGWGEIVSLYVLPEYFGKGVGKPLLDYALSSLLEMGYERIYLWVLEENTRARRFYEKNGFSVSPDREHINIGNKDLVEVRYKYYP